MIFETKDDFESLLNDYLPSKDNSKSEKSENYKLYGVSETNRERKEKEYLTFQNNYKKHCNCKNSSNNKLKIMHNTLQSALDKIAGVNESIYVCPKNTKFRIYHTSTN
tara:strand:+ start:22 stop:345 length:324 start_codon:yes stop_codon:yes gene_type:complete